MLWAFASPPLLILAAVKLVFFYSRLSTGATFLYILLALVAIGGLVMLGLIRSKRPLECECPACGKLVWFEFAKQPTPPDLSIARCDKCLIYVCRREVDISEAALETTNDVERFIVHSNQYETNVRRNAEGRIAFDMPTFCALCGAAEAPYLLKAEISYSDTSVNTELVRQANYARTGSRGHGVGSGSAVTRISGTDFLGQQVAVCAQHQAPTTRPVPLSISDWGGLYFASYRFYKAFVAANHISPPGAEGLPAARVRS